MLNKWFAPVKCYWLTLNRVCICCVWCWRRRDSHTPTRGACPKVISVQSSDTDQPSPGNPLLSMGLLWASQGTCCCSPPTEVFFRELKLIRVFLHEHSLVRVGALWYSLQKWLSIRCWPRQSTNECLLEGWGLVKLEMTGPKRADGSHSGFSPNLNSLFYKRVADTFLCGRRFERFPSISPVSSLCGDVSLKRTSPHLSRASSFLNQSEVLFTRSSVFLMSLLAPLYQPAALFCWLMDRWTPTYLSSPSSDVILTLLLHQTPLPE